MTRVLVTGCAGFIGSHLVPVLLQDRDTSVVGVDAFTPYYDPAIKRRNAALLSAERGFSLLEGDIRDEQVLGHLAARGPYDAVVHLAAEVGVRESLRRPADYVSTNVWGTARLMERLKSPGANTHFVLASSSSVYGASPRLPYAEDEPCDAQLSPYAASKRSMELHASSLSAAEEQHVTCLRFFTVFGPRQRPEMAITGFARRIQRGETITLFAPELNRRDFTYVSDIVDGIQRALRRPREPRFRVYNLGSGRLTTLPEMVQGLEEVLGRKAVVRVEGRAAGDMEHTLADLSRSRTELGYEPRITFQQGLELSAEYLRSLG